MATSVDFDLEFIKKGYRLICGVDEVGRGPLAGPVTVGSVIMDLENPIKGIDDSKKLSESKRERLYELIINNAISFNTVSIEPEEIDEINILNATKKAMVECVNGLFPIPDLALIDAVRESFVCPSCSIIKGDALSYSIGAASILAKVTRDRKMLEYAELYPDYGFEKNKGYGTKYHIEQLKKLGPTPIHRQSFIKNFL